MTCYAVAVVFKPQGWEEPRGSGQFDYYSDPVQADHAAGRRGVPVLTASRPGEFDGRYDLGVVP